MKNKITKLCALFIIFAVGFSSLNGMAIAANNQVNPTGDAPDGIVNNTPPNFTVSSLTVIYVPDDYPTIQAAIDNASTGDTIIVRNGTYTENIDVNKRLTIESENGSDFTLVQAQNSNDHVFNVTANYVNITGFIVENATGEGKAGIYLYGIEHCNITNNIVSNSNSGIYINSTHNSVMDNNTVSDSGAGISLENSTHNNVTNNNVSNANWAIALWQSSHFNRVINNTIFNTTGIGTAQGVMGFAIEMMGSSNNLIDNNHVSNTTASGMSASAVAIFIGTYYGPANDNTITNNEIYNTTASGENAIGIGIYVDSANNNTLINNTVNSNDRGIMLYNSASNNTLTSNNASDNDYGIFLSSSSSNTLSNNTVKSNNYDGILFYSSSYNTLSNNTVKSNNYNGIRLDSSGNNTISNNTANSNNYNGIDLSSSVNNTLSNNTASNNGNGIRLDSSSNNTIYNNYFNNANNWYVDGGSGNKWNITKTLGTNIIGGPYLGGNFWWDYTGIDDGSNGGVAGDGIGDTGVPYGPGDYLPLLNANPTVYNVNQNNWYPTIQLAHDTATAGDTIWVYANYTNYAGIGIKESVTITKNNLTIKAVEPNVIVSPPDNSQDGFYLDTVSGVTIEGFTVQNANHGIYLSSSSNNNITNNTVKSNNYDGILFYSSSSNIISNNTANSNNYHGIFLSSSSSNTLSNNTANSNIFDGIILDSSSSNTLSNNNASNNEDGIILNSSSNNTISNNNVSNNYYGIILDSSSNNTIYNNYFNNTNNAYDDGNNIWNISKTLGTNIIDGSYLGGNYWSDYTGEDLDGDGLGDTSYDIGGTNDQLPLVEPTADSVFDTGSSTSPSISGTHNGTIIPNQDISVTKVYTYPCAGTGGHAESVKIWNETWDVTATWNGYTGDYHNITFDESFILRAGETYNYTIITGSYPQIIHATSLEVTGGTVTCTEFTDVNGVTYNNWIPAIRLE